MSLAHYQQIAVKLMAQPLVSVVVNMHTAVPAAYLAAMPRQFQRPLPPCSPLAGSEILLINVLRPVTDVSPSAACITEGYVTVQKMLVSHLVLCLNFPTALPAQKRRVYHVVSREAKTPVH
jgi:hypothetical protein